MGDSWLATDGAVTERTEAMSATRIERDPLGELPANRANELLGGKRGEYQPVHPNDHVNMAQSTNDVIPTAIRLAALAQLPALLEALSRLARAFLAKGKAFDAILKAGRTHLQD